MISEKSVERMTNRDAQNQFEAPGFELPGTTGVRWTLHRLADYTGDGVAVLGFYPFDSLDDARPLSWLQFTEGIDVVAVSNVRCTVVEGNESPAPLEFPLLCDADEDVGFAYGTDYDDPTAQRVFLVDSSHEIHRSWPADADPRDVYETALGYIEGNPRATQGGVD